jgi:hypothetical protein
MPPVGVSTGRSLGWASRKKPSEPVDRFKAAAPPRCLAGLMLRKEWPCPLIAVEFGQEGVLPIRSGRGSGPDDLSRDPRIKAIPPRPAGRGLQTLAEGPISI